MVTLPGQGSSTDGTYEYNVEETKELFESIINKKAPSEEEADGTLEVDGEESTTDDGVTSEEETKIEVEPLVIVDATTFSISVQNGTRVSGLASKTKEKLEAAGFKVLEVGNYETKPIERTIIKVPLEEVGEALADYFNNPEIIVDETLKGKDIEVIIAVGTKDSEN
jgi:hypothetical protein